MILSKIVCPLSNLDIFNNHITGTLPLEVTNIKEFQIFHVKKNQMSGPIPSSYGEMPNLFWFGK
jgi:hypothetical protein